MSYYVFPQQEAVHANIKKTLAVFKASEAKIRPHFHLTGPSGTGKTHLLKTVCEFLKMPFIEVSAAQLTAEGLSGNSLSKALRNLRLHWNEPNVIFVDEFDKLFQRNGEHTEGFRSAVQDERAAAATAASEYAPKGDSLGGDFARWARGMAANYGAGTQNVVDAVKQMFGADSAPTDQEVRDRRMRDKELADSTYGGSLMQILGEVAPTLGVPAGGFVRGARGRLVLPFGRPIVRLLSVSFAKR